MTDIEFGELPPPGPSSRGGGHLAAAYEALRSRPGEWAKIKTYSSPSSANGSGRHLKNRYPGCETTIRGSDLWARYVGEGS